MSIEIPSQDIALVWFLLIWFNIKHFLADYVFQTAYMLQKANTSNWLRPLILHCAVHGALTWCVAFLAIGAWALLIAVLDTLIHFAIDYWKAHNLRYPLNSRPFWIAFGADQLLHSLTYIVLTFVAVKFV